MALVLGVGLNLGLNSAGIWVGFQITVLGHIFRRWMVRLAPNLHPHRNHVSLSLTKPKPKVRVNVRIRAWGRVRGWVWVWVWRNPNVWCNPLTISFFKMKETILFF